MNHHFPGLHGGEISLAALQGQVVLVVNTASRCGFTPQYRGLEQLYQAQRARGLVVIGVPCDDFGGQEPDDEAGVAQFCALNYGVTFPMTAKQRVKGPAAHPFYRAARQRFGWLGAPKWNFHKYLIARSGAWSAYFHSVTTPDSPRLLAALEHALAPGGADR